MKRISILLLTIGLFIVDLSNSSEEDERLDVENSRSNDHSKAKRQQNSAQEGMRGMALRLQTHAEQSRSAQAKERHADIERQIANGFDDNDVAMAEEHQNYISRLPARRQEANEALRVAAIELQGQISSRAATLNQQFEENEREKTERRQRRGDRKNRGS